MKDWYKERSDKVCRFLQKQVPNIHHCPSKTNVIVSYLCLKKNTYPINILHKLNICITI